MGEHPQAPKEKGKIGALFRVGFDRGCVGADGMYTWGSTKGRGILGALLKSKDALTGPPATDGLLG